MTLKEFKDTLDKNTIPDTAPLLQALWHDAKGDWHAAHVLAQDIHTGEGAWVHAYLHRKEGDVSNARYWYRQAGKPEHKGTLQQEWEELVAFFLSERTN